MVTCTVWSNPPSKVTWTKRNKNDSGSALLARNTINITWDLGPGEYVCHAANIIGYQKASMRVYVDYNVTTSNDSKVVVRHRKTEKQQVNNNTGGSFGIGVGILSFVFCLVVIRRKTRLVDKIL